MSEPTIIPENGFYVHYKHDPSAAPHDHMYEVVGLARNTEEKNYSVLYRPLYENDWFAPVIYQSRPLNIFMETVEKEGIATPRFKKIIDPQLIQDLTVIRDKMYPKSLE
ncbi:DUF1653 domain-containing protein [Candidatus Kaiserbacteria bacterium]|nr:DUF1653 domain-containing protein [Candidatus Kaiserbacteria bacterium]